MGTWPFIILAAVLGLIVWLLGGCDTGGTNDRGPGVDDCGRKKKPSTWGGPR